MAEQEPTKPDPGSSYFRDLHGAVRKGDQEARERLQVRAEAEGLNGEPMSPEDRCLLALCIVGAAVIICMALLIGSCSVQQRRASCDHLTKVHSERPC